MTTPAVNYWTHGEEEAKQMHAWEYLGKARQAYRCRICQLVVSKTALKENTDA